MSKYNRKKENPALTPDEFIGFWQRAFTVIQPYARGIAWTLLGFVAVLAIVGLVTNRLEQRAEAATEAWGHAVRVYEADLLTDDATKEAKDAKDKTPEDNITRYKTAKERAEATLAELDKLPPVAAKNAGVFRAGVLYDLERYEDAQKAYTEAAAGTDPAITTVAREGIALCYEQLGKLDEALAAFEKVAPSGDKATEFYRDRALMDLGRVLEKKGDKKGAIERYKEIVAKFATSALHEDAQNRLAVLEAP